MAIRPDRLIAPKTLNLTTKTDNHENLIRKYLLYQAFQMSTDYPNT